MTKQNKIRSKIRQNQVNFISLMKALLKALTQSLVPIDDLSTE